MPKFRKLFWSPYEQYADRIGQPFEVIRELTDEERDPEVGPMWRIRFLTDGFETDAWPEEILEEEEEDPVEIVLTQLKENGILVSHPVKVRDYLLRYPDMVEVLALASQLSLTRFRASAELSLEVYCDPESKEEYLVLYVRQDNYSGDIVKQIKKVRSAYSPYLANRAGWLLLTTDFGPPRSVRNNRDL